MSSTVRYRISNNLMMETVYYKFNSSTVFKCAMNSFNETFPPVRIFLLAVMHTPSYLPHFPIYKGGRQERQEL